MTLRAVVVDDEDLPRGRVKDLVTGHASLTLAGEAADGMSALDLIVAEKPDVVFLDVQMPELTGFEVVAALPEDISPAIVFVTAYDAYAMQAFEVGAFDYLLKPVTQERFNTAVERVVQRTSASAQLDLVRQLAEHAVRSQGQPTRLVARRGGKHYLVPVAEVEWLEAERNYVRVHTSNDAHLVRRTMKQLEAQLDSNEFVRVHRSAIVAIKHIASLEAGEHGEYGVVMRSGVRLMSSRSYGRRLSALLK
jgi:two-component system, LytTR family, response regulator